MFIKTVKPSAKPANISGSAHSTPAVQEEEQGHKEITFNTKRLSTAAMLLVVLLAAVIGTAFFEQLAKVHTMLMHAFELILGATVGLLGGEVIAKVEKN